MRMTPVYEQAGAELATLLEQAGDATPEVQQTVRRFADLYGKLAEEHEYLLRRASLAGSLSFGQRRETGASANGLVAFAISGLEPASAPCDGDDLGACELTYENAPAHLKPRMLPLLERFRAEVVSRSEPGQQVLIADGSGRIGEIVSLADGELTVRFDDGAEATFPFSEVTAAPPRSSGMPLTVFADTLIALSKEQGDLQIG